MQKFENINFDDISEAESDTLRMYKSKIYQIAKCAEKLFKSLNSEDQIQEWMKSGIIDSYNSLEKVSDYVEYESSFPEVKDPIGDSEEPEKEQNNFLTNEDKRFPTPQDNEAGDNFMSRCLADPSMKGRYPEQADRFMACMLIYNKPPKNEANNPGEKFEDPMSKQEEEMDPEKPILP